MLTYFWAGAVDGGPTIRSTSRVSWDKHPFHDFGTPHFRRRSCFFHELPTKPIVSRTRLLIRGLFWFEKQMIDPYVILAMPFNFILSSSHFYYRNTQCFLWQCHLPWFIVILCILSYDFGKLTILYIHLHISLSFLWQISLWWLSFSQ